MADDWARTTRGRVVRVGLAVLAAAHLFWGVWAVVWPRHFFDNFPGLGRYWTASYPPFNEHLMVDVGAAFLTLGVLLAYPAIRPDPRLARLALTGYVVFAALHLAFHLRHHGTLTGADLVTSLLSLVAGVVLPIGLLVLTRGGAQPGNGGKQA